MLAALPSLESIGEYPKAAALWRRLFTSDMKNSSAPASSTESINKKHKAVTATSQCFVPFHHYCTILDHTACPESGCKGQVVLHVL